MEQTIKIELSVSSLTSEQKQALATLLGLNVATKPAKSEKSKPSPAAPAAPVEVAPVAPVAPAAPVEVAPAAPAAPVAATPTVTPNVPIGQIPSAPGMPTAPNVQMPSAPVMPTAPTAPTMPTFAQPAAPVAPVATPMGQSQPRVVVMGEQFTFDGINITENAVRMAAGAAAVQGGKRDVIFAKLTEMGFKDVVSLINWWRENHDATYAAMFYEFLKTL